MILLDAKGSLIGATGESAATATPVSTLLPRGTSVYVYVCVHARTRVRFLEMEHVLPKKSGWPRWGGTQFVEVTNHGVASPFFISGVGREQ